MLQTIPRPPKHLGPATKKWWKSVTRRWGLEQHHVLVVTAAAEPDAGSPQHERKETMAKEMGVPKPRLEKISPTQLYLMADGLYPKPPEDNGWEELVDPGLLYPTIDFHGSKALWEQVAEEILHDWVTQRPGRRPRLWWHFTAPRISQAELEKHPRWTGAWYVVQLCEPRLRLGGIGTPIYEVLNYVPEFEYGIPVHWVSEWEERYYSGRAKDVRGNPIGSKFHEGHFEGTAIDPADPPRFESQAAYLERHGLLFPNEKRRLKPMDFQPEAITTEDMK